MARTNSTPPVPKDWQTYINKTARNFATGMFDKDDAQQVALEAFLRARNGYNPVKGPFENYAKVAIYNALLNARMTEQRFWGGGEAPDDDTTDEVAPEPWEAEDATLDLITMNNAAADISAWRQCLPSKPAALVEALYYRDQSQREFAESEGVTQARISQRNVEVLGVARRALAHLRM
ncbi:sigma-70 family RNA polymerase sigma factor [Sphingomonas sp. LB2R24]|uniref:sigma-70 family RNA polymerase sigma factor n=1 Tax=Sphingomonas sorbitolis TaxID=3096165 RepID=UPI002FCB3CDF